MPQKISCSNAVCVEFSFSLFNSFNTINVGEKDLVYITALLHPPFNTLTEKHKETSLKSLFNFGCSSQGLVTVITGRQEWRALCQAKHTCLWGSVAHVPPGWLMPLMVGIMRGRGVTQGSVQSQKWLSVLILSLLLMLQSPSFYHGL